MKKRAAMLLTGMMVLSLAVPCAAGAEETNDSEYYYVNGKAPEEVTGNILFWSWDPKETWALITWLVYAAYLHTRFLKGFKGKRAAWLSVLGFIAVIFTFFGVSYLLPGMHSYLV